VTTCKVFRSNASLANHNFAVDIHVVVTHHQDLVEGSASWAGHVGGAAEGTFDKVEAREGVGVDSCNHVVVRAPTVPSCGVVCGCWNSRGGGDILCAIGVDTGSVTGQKGRVEVKTWGTGEDVGFSVSAFDEFGAVVWMVVDTVGPAVQVAGIGYINPLRKTHGHVLWVVALSLDGVEHGAVGAVDFGGDVVAALDEHGAVVGVGVHAIRPVEP